uniref:DNA-directed RNA polymerase subunit beta' n=1 Tax=Sarcinofilum mucosum TaxID=141643 RepID=A0A1W6EGB1_SARMC|nr:beta' subunit of RNA polymerase [Sarcinofilum mucosum]ARK14429.1 beta' subunit of RNA polymerase [Sarcinofilum mucosum]
MTSKVKNPTGPEPYKSKPASPLIKLLKGKSLNFPFHSGKKTTKYASLHSLSLRLASPKVIKQWSERTLPNGEIVGQITNAQTVNYKTLKPEKGGLFCERVFGPVKDFYCSCGKTATFPFGPARDKANQKLCLVCGVEFISSQSRRSKMGYIKLISPVTHVWYLKSSPSYISLLLNLKKKNLEAVTYCSENFSFNIKSFKNDLTFQNLWPLLLTSSTPFFDAPSSNSLYYLEPPVRRSYVSRPLPLFLSEKQFFDDKVSPVANKAQDYNTTTTPGFFLENGLKKKTKLKSDCFPQKTGDLQRNWNRFLSDNLYFKDPCVQLKPDFPFFLVNENKALQKKFFVQTLQTKPNSQFKLNQTFNSHFVKKKDLDLLPLINPYSKSLKESKNFIRSNVLEDFYTKQYNFSLASKLDPLHQSFLNLSSRKYPPSFKFNPGVGRTYEGLSQTKFPTSIGSDGSTPASPLLIFFFDAPSKTTTSPKVFFSLLNYQILLKVIEPCNFSTSYTVEKPTPSFFHTFSRDDFQFCLRRPVRRDLKPLLFSQQVTISGAVNNDRSFLKFFSLNRKDILVFNYFGVAFDYALIQKNSLISGEQSSNSAASTNLTDRLNPTPNPRRKSHVNLKTLSEFQLNIRFKVPLQKGKKPSYFSLKPLTLDTYNPVKQVFSWSTPFQFQFQSRDFVFLKHRGSSWGPNFQLNGKLCRQSNSLTDALRPIQEDDLRTTYGRGFKNDENPFIQTDGSLPKELIRHCLSHNFKKPLKNPVLKNPLGNLKFRNYFSVKLVLSLKRAGLVCQFKKLKTLTLAALAAPALPDEVRTKDSQMGPPVIVGLKDPSAFKRAKKSDEPQSLTFPGEKTRGHITRPGQRTESPDTQVKPDIHLSNIKTEPKKYRTSTRGVLRPEGFDLFFHLLFLTFDNFKLSSKFSQLQFTSKITPQGKFNAKIEIFSYELLSFPVEKLCLLDTSALKRAQKSYATEKKSLNSKTPKKTQSKGLQTLLFLNVNKQLQKIIATSTLENSQEVLYFLQNLNGSGYLCLSPVSTGAVTHLVPKVEFKNSKNPFFNGSLVANSVDLKKKLETQDPPFFNELVKPFSSPVNGSYKPIEAYNDFLPSAVALTGPVESLGIHPNPVDKKTLPEYLCGPLKTWDTVETETWNSVKLTDFSEKLERTLFLKKPILVNNFYTISQSFQWRFQKDWAGFLNYMTTMADAKDSLIPSYLERGISFDLVSTGAGSLKIFLSLFNPNYSGPKTEREYNSPKENILGLRRRRIAFPRGKVGEYDLRTTYGSLTKNASFPVDCLMLNINSALSKHNQEIKKLEDFFKFQSFLVYDEEFIEKSFKKLVLLRTLRSKALRRLKVLRPFKRSRVLPEWMILSVLPVLPPALRPIIPLDSQQVAVSDLNKFYQTVLFRNKRVKRFYSDYYSLNFSEEMRYAQRLLQEAVDALIENGKGDSPVITAANNRPLKSLSDMIKGKKGRFRQNLLGKRVDYSGRSVIVVGPQLKLHECGLPKEMAIELFQPFLIRQLILKKVARNFISAKKLIKSSSWSNPDGFLDILREVMANRPVLLNRAPTLHRLGIQAFQPKLVAGRAILLHPLVCTAFNADFDGDQMAVHIPLSFQACSEAWKLMGSRNSLLSPATGEPIILPSQDMVLGCYYLTTIDRVQIRKNFQQSPFLLPQSSSAEKNQKPFPTTGVPGESGQVSRASEFSPPDLSRHPMENSLFRKCLQTTNKEFEKRFYNIEPFSSSSSTPDGERDSGGGINKSRRLVDNFAIYYFLRRSGPRGRGGPRIPNHSNKYYSNWDQVLQDMNQQLIHFHTPVWLRWSSSFEFSVKRENCLETRLDKFGNSVFIKQTYQTNLNSKYDQAVFYIRTTPGRILMNQLIFEALNQPDQKHYPLIFKNFQRGR